MRRAILWISVLSALALIVAVVFVRGMGITARRTPPAAEQRLMKAGWRFLVPLDVRQAPNPVPNTPEVLQHALEHFADHCAICHANDGGGDSLIGRRVYPPAPDLRGRATQDLSDGELFYAIEEGIPWTAMPGWKTGSPDGERLSWELVRFIRHLPALTPDEVSQMEALNPRSPAQEKRDRQIEEFLRGQQPRKKGG